MVVKKRRTPVDDPAVLQDWIEIHRHNIEEVRMSKRQSFYSISKHYNCDWTTAKYWLEPKVRASSIKRRKTSRVSYSKDPRMQERRIHSRIYSDICRNVDIYLKEIYGGHDKSFSVSDITDCLHKLTGIEVRNKTLYKTVALWEQRHGKELLVQDGNYQPPRYRVIY